ncbi:MAG: DUF2784 domain-containing protein [Candidatus Eremiobacteraeota bacterium]|nr:DUF2784 domain-containing protein [Candidatus Eremiobacteraeota bacterium]MBC5826555.1 DUF2784 domain-containing protein [Candidatus Eremiobacteraeota bacterium]
MNEANAVLALHLTVAAFNVFGLLAVPLGLWRGWRFVSIFWWRALHLASLALVALQKLLGRSCFLTLWESKLRAGTVVGQTTWFQNMADRVLFWNLPLWFFGLLYALVLAYALFLWHWAPPAMNQRTPRGRSCLHTSL